VDVKYTLIAKMFEKKVNFLLKGRKEREPTKTKVIVSGGSISKFFLSKIPLKQRMCQRKNF
jgi:hypothetical protein